MMEGICFFELWVGNLGLRLGWVITGFSTGHRNCRHDPSYVGFCVDSHWVGVCLGELYREFLVQVASCL